ncbi:MAG TPA: FkbM family methyltransferase [Caulobacteraceae bacterium]|jgi:FkbM family methyltransferase|nr:FkbM family methyltransferase [Caulobacteraceae bacterium]
MWKPLAWAFSGLFARAVYRDGSEAELLQAFFDSDTGVFVEVGANDPIQGSQSFAFEQRGWIGLLIEPLSECVDNLRRVRKAKVCAAAAGSPEDEGKELPMLVAGHLGGLSTLSTSNKMMFEGDSTRLVPIRTLDSMLAEAGIGAIDFLSIDVEGHEIDVLRGFSIERHQPRLILLEDDVHTRSKHAYLTARGYVLVRRTNLNNWYVRKPARLAISLFGRWQLFRKMRLGVPIRRLRYALWARRKQAERARLSDRTATFGD